MTPTAGQPAPDFALADDTGATVHLADLRGRRVVLYFYPKDDTPGCTRQACALRDSWGDLEAGARIFRRLARRAWRATPRSATSSASRSPCWPIPTAPRSRRTASGASGRTVGSASIRSTVLIDEDGTIERVWSPVDPDEHIDIIREALAA